MDSPDIQLCVEGFAGPYLMVKPAFIAKVETWLRDHGVYFATNEGVVSDEDDGAELVDVINFGVVAHPNDILPHLRTMSAELSLSLTEPKSEAYLADHPPIHVDSSGVPRIAGTRVTLDSIVHSFQRGATPEQTADEYPTLPLSEIYAVVAFYLSHRDQIERDMARRRSQADEHRRQSQARPEYVALRQRLIASRPATR